MGVAPNIDAVVFPVQGAHLHAKVKVCFHYDAARAVGGIVVRDDATDPYVTIIRLDDGRFVLATECQYALLPPETP